MMPGKTSVRESQPFLLDGGMGDKDQFISHCFAMNA
jgi:hypothetical protein